MSTCDTAYIFFSSFLRWESFQRPRSGPALSLSKGRFLFLMAVFLRLYLLWDVRGNRVSRIENRALFVQKCGRSNWLFSIAYWLPRDRDLRYWSSACLIQNRANQWNLWPIFKQNAQGGKSRNRKVWKFSYLFQHNDLRHNFRLQFCRISFNSRMLL